MVDLEPRAPERQGETYFDPTGGGFTARCLKEALALRSSTSRSQRGTSSDLVAGARFGTFRRSVEIR